MEYERQAVKIYPESCVYDKFPAIAPSAAHNFSVKTIEFKMAAVSVKRSIGAKC